MNKICTSLEQSKKLIELGVDVNTADMHHVLIDSDKEIYDIGLGNYIGILPHYPAWSLAALLDVIPNYKLSSEHNYHTCIAETSLRKETVAWFDNPIDACYEMIIKLKEQNLL